MTLADTPAFATSSALARVAPRSASSTRARAGVSLAGAARSLKSRCARRRFDALGVRAAMRSTAPRGVSVQRAIQSTKSRSGCESRGKA